MMYLAQQCGKWQGTDLVDIPISQDDMVMLTALARELGIVSESPEFSVRVLITAIAKCFFTVVREYEQVTEGVSIVLSPQQWEHWAETGEMPSQRNTLAEIDALIIRMGKVRERIAKENQKRTWGDECYFEDSPF